MELLAAALTLLICILAVWGHGLGKSLDLANKTINQLMTDNRILSRELMELRSGNTVDLPEKRDISKLRWPLGYNATDEYDL